MPSHSDRHSVELGQARPTAACSASIAVQELTPGHSRLVLAQATTGKRRKLSRKCKEHIESICNIVVVFFDISSEFWFLNFGVPSFFGGSGGYKKFREACRKISSKDLLKRSPSCRVKTKEPNKFTTIEFATTKLKFERIYHRIMGVQKLP